MKIRFLNLLLIGSIVSSVIMTSCSKDEDDNSSPNGGNSDPTGDTGTFTDSRDSKTYKWVKIGEQVWMAENLNFTGSGIQHITDVSEWRNNEDDDGWCYYENNDNYGNTYGALYQWEAAKTACPDGWHLPTDDEWKTLTNYLKANDYSCDGEIGGSRIAKSLATDNGWNISEAQYSIGNLDYTEYRNKTGFSALPSGDRNLSGGFGGLGGDGSWWSATEYNSSNFAYYRYLNYNNSEVSRFNDDKSYGFSVRCVRD